MRTLIAADGIIDIVHGDIKPCNVLMYEEDSRFTAKVADFGFATCLQSESDLLSIPISEPWNAPELSNSLVKPDSAKRMDIYSYGLLCTWLLFEAGSSTGLSLPPDTKLKTDEFIGFKSCQSKKNLLELWKRDTSDKVIEWTSWLLREDKSLSSSSKDHLLCFFKSTLTVNPKSRCIEFDQLIGFLMPTR